VIKADIVGITFPQDKRSVSPNLGSLQIVPGRGTYQLSILKCETSGHCEIQSHFAMHVHKWLYSLQIKGEDAG